MKKCKKCGALQSDDRSVCLDCGSVLGRPMTDAEEAAAEEALDDKLEAMSERTEDFHVSLREKIMGVLCIVGVIAAFVLIGLCGNAEYDIQEALSDGVFTTAGYYSTESGFTTGYSVGSTKYDRMNEPEQAAAFGIISVISLVFAFPMLLFPKFVWKLSTLRYRIFYEWDTTPSDWALIASKVSSYLLFGVGMFLLLWGWILYL